VHVPVDLFWYDHRDWPQGNALVTGHACTLATIYWFAALWPSQGVPSFR
jgi:hypothetical protein